MLTPFGREVRKLRVDKDVNLKQMAEFLGVPSSFLSAIENGRRPVPEKMLNEVCRYFAEMGLDLNYWRKLAEDSVPKITLDLVGASPEDRMTQVTFARKYRDLPADRKKRLQELLED